MGGKESKPSILSYEDAVNRVTKVELARLQNAYKAACAFSGVMRENVLTRVVLGDFVPAKLAQRIFDVMSSSSRGMTQRDLITALVLLTRGKQDERLKLIYAVYTDANGLYVSRRSMALMVTACEGMSLPHEAAQLFLSADRVLPEVFCNWIRNHPDITTVSKWLLNYGGVTVSLTDSTEMPNFYQTLAGVTHLEESDIIDLEKHYWTLKSQSKTGRFDLQTFKSIVCPPLPESVVEGLFDAFDQNSDNHIDFKEISCGVSACCRGPLAERQKFCFKVFDRDQDGKLNEEELKSMAVSLLEVKGMTKRRSGANKDSSTLARGRTFSNKELRLNLVSPTSGSEKPVVRNALSPVAANPPTMVKVAGSKFFDLSATEGQSPKSIKLASNTVESSVSNSDEKETEETENKDVPSKDDVDMVVSSALQYAVDGDGCLTLEEYQMWGMDDTCPNLFLNIVIELCHIVLGLRPSTPQEEGMIIRGWMQRCDYHEVNPGETWYVVAADWWNKWKKFTTYDPILSPSQSRKWEYEALECDVDHTQHHDRSSSTDTISSAIEASETLSHANHTKQSRKTQNKLHLPSKKKSKSKENISTVSAGVNSQASSKANNNSPGPIVNSSILVEETHKVTTLTDEGGRLKDTVICEEDFNLLPEPVWKVLHHWYGGSQTLPRIVPAPVEGEKAEIELYRLHILLLKHQAPPSNHQNMHIFPGGSTIAEVGNATFGMLRASLNYVTGLNSSPKRFLTYRATFSKRHTIKQVQTFLAYRIHMHYDNIRLWNYIDENNAFVMEEDTASLEDFGVKDNSQVLIEVRNIDLSWPEEMYQLTKNKKTKLKPAVEKGVTGLSNIGNTCFMNAGLQCISNTQPLTEYFRSNKHLYELNRSNPLGMKGHIAKRYGDLVQDLWSGNSKSIAPLKLRWTISKYAPRFNGFSQHDSQELLSFLLDGLHEDLNRVQEKPYVELKDSDGRPDEEVAQEAWENHLMRNQSIIIDLFHGQIRSQVRCMQCSAVSVRFDPFTFLSLPLPMDNSMYLDVTLVKLDGKTPTKYGLQLSMEDKYVEVRTRLSKLCDIDSDNILLVEIAGAKVKSFISDTQKVRSAIGGTLYAFEIPPPQTIDLEMPETPGKKQPIMKRIEKPEPYFTSHETRKTSISNMNADYMESDVSLKGDSNSNVMNGMPESPSPNDLNPNQESGTSFTEGEAPKTVPWHNGFKNCSIPNGDIRYDMVKSDSESTLTSSASNKTTTQIKSQCYVVAVHRKMFHQEVYFLSPQKIQRSLFGVPVVVPYIPGKTKRALYESVWNQVSRLVSPLPPSDGANHAQDCDDSLRSQYPFILRSVQRCGTLCGEGCPWFKFCHGCVIDCENVQFFSESGFIAIDWDPTALHLRYQPSMERDVTNHESVDESTKGQRKPIDLDHCLRAFTTEEELGADELYYCGKCKKHQLAKKKLDIWRLPPILIIHLKRFQFVNGHWIKSHKVVNVQKIDFDASNFMTKRDGKTATRTSVKNKIEQLSGKLETNGDVSESKSHKRIKFADEDKSRNSTQYKESGDPGQSSDKPAIFSDSPNARRRRSHSAGPARERKPSFREEEKPLFDLHAVSCHSGIICGGHYVAYAKNPSGKWYCFNDSSCKEVKEDEISIDTSYILFYERQGLNYEDFMPSTEGKQQVDISNMDDDFNSEYKKYCSIQ